MPQVWGVSQVYIALIKTSLSAFLHLSSRQASFSGSNNTTPGGDVGSALYAAGIQGWARGPGAGQFGEAGSRSTNKPMSQVQLAPLGSMDSTQGAGRARPHTVPAHSPWWVCKM